MSYSFGFLFKELRNSHDVIPDLILLLALFHSFHFPRFLEAWPSFRWFVWGYKLCFCSDLAPVPVPVPILHLFIFGFYSVDVQCIIFTHLGRCENVHTMLLWTWFSPCLASADRGTGCRVILRTFLISVKVMPGQWKNIVYLKKDLFNYRIYLTTLNSAD